MLFSTLTLTITLSLILGLSYGENATYERYDTGTPTEEVQDETTEKVQDETTEGTIIKNNTGQGVLQLKLTLDDKYLKLSNQLRCKVDWFVGIDRVIWTMNYRPINKNEFSILRKEAVFILQPKALRFPPGRYSCKFSSIYSNEIEISYYTGKPCDAYSDYECDITMMCFVNNEFSRNGTCLPREVDYGGSCQLSSQCKGYEMHCDSKQKLCWCKPTYVPYYEHFTYFCRKSRPNVIPASDLNKDVYKAAIVALSCFVVTVIGLIALFLCNRQFIGRRRSNLGSIGTHFTCHQGTNDLLNVTDGLAAMRHIDKPPTYQEVVVQDQAVRGVPPPAYNTAIASTSTERVANDMASMVINSQLQDMARNGSVNQQPIIINTQIQEIIRNTSANQRPSNLPQQQSSSESTASTSNGVSNAGFVQDG